MDSTDSDDTDDDDSDWSDDDLCGKTSNSQPPVKHPAGTSVFYYETVMNSKIADPHWYNNVPTTGWRAESACREAQDVTDTIPSSAQFMRQAGSSKGWSRDVF